MTKNLALVTSLLYALSNLQVSWELGLLLASASEGVEPVNQGMSDSRSFCFLWDLSSSSSDSESAPLSRLVVLFLVADPKSAGVSRVSPCAANRSKEDWIERISVR